MWLPVLAAGGTLSLARAFQRPLLAEGLVCAVLAGMLLIDLWIALGPGAKQCVSRAHAFGPGTPMSEFACRSVFGVGALLVGGSSRLQFAAGSVAGQWANNSFKPKPLRGTG